jgi:hypothetical protein
MKVNRVTEAITLTLGADVIAYLAREANRRRTSKSQVVREMVANVMEKDTGGVIVSDWRCATVKKGSIKGHSRGKQTQGATT